MRDLSDYHAHQCLRCGHAWLSVHESPTSCARCKSRAWRSGKRERGKRGGSLPTVEAILREQAEALADLQDRVAALERGGQRQPTANRPAADRDGQTLDYGAFGV